MTGEAAGTETEPERHCFFQTSLNAEKKLIERIKYPSINAGRRAMAAHLVTQASLDSHKEEIRKRGGDCWEYCQGGPKCAIADWIIKTRSAAAGAWPQEAWPTLDAGEHVLDGGVAEPRTHTGFAPDSNVDN